MYTLQDIAKICLQYQKYIENVILAFSQIKEDTRVLADLNYVYYVRCEGYNVKEYKSEQGVRGVKEYTEKDIIYTTYSNIYRI